MSVGAVPAQANTVRGVAPGASAETIAATNAANMAALAAPPPVATTITTPGPTPDGIYRIPPGANLREEYDRLIAQGVDPSKIQYWNARAGSGGGYIPYGSTVYSGPGASTISGISTTIADGRNALIDTAKNVVKGVGNAVGIGGEAPTVNTTAAQADIDRARSLSQQFSEAYTNFTPGVSPTIAQTRLDPQREAVAGQVGNVPQVVAPNVGGAQQVSAATVGQFLGAGGASASGGVATAGTVGAYERAIAERAEVERLDAAKQEEFRQSQQTLLGYLTGAIEGTAPSVAQLQLDQATQRNAANQLGLASANSRGGNSALATRTAANNIALINQRAASDAALLRATEIATARGQYGDAASTGRGQDITFADRNATLGTDVSKTNATLGTQVNVTNASNQLDAQKTQAGLDTSASIATAGNATQASVATANNSTAASIANSNNSLASQIAQAKLTQEAGTTNANNATSLQQLQAQLLYNASHDNAGNALSAEQTNANLQTQASTTNATNATNLNTTQGQLNNAANINNAANTVTTAGQNITSQQNAAGNAITTTGQVIQGNANVLDNSTRLAAAKIDADAKERAALYGAAGAAGSTLLSDERTKTAIKDGEGDAQDLLDHLSAHSFSYKDQRNGRGRQTGVMAQDVQKSKAGRTFVRETPRGKALDPIAGFGSVLAMLSTLNERVKGMEARG